MKLAKWTPNDGKHAEDMGWQMRPWRYEESDGCWTIRHTAGGPFKNHYDAVIFVLQRAFFRDGCESELQWRICHKAAVLAMGAEPTL